MRKAKTAAIAVGSAAAIIAGGFFINCAVSPVLGQADRKGSVEVYDVQDNVTAKLAALTSIRSNTTTGKATMAATVNRCPAEFDYYGYSAAPYTENYDYSAETATEAATEVYTSAPTEAYTYAPTEAATYAPTEAATYAPTEALTAAPTQAPTAAPTEAPTAAPTQAPAPTAAPTDAPEFVQVYYAEQPVITYETPVPEAAPAVPETEFIPVVEAAPAPVQTVEEAPAPVQTVESAPSAGVSDEDFVILCNAVAHEAGCYWISAEDKAKVVEVIMNRVNSPLYPNTILGVLTQPNQFTGAEKYVYLGCYSSDVNQGVIDAVNLYFSDPSSFSHGYFSFWGDGTQNHFS